MNEEQMQHRDEFVRGLCRERDALRAEVESLRVALGRIVADEMTGELRLDLAEKAGGAITVDQLRACIDAARGAE